MKKFYNIKQLTYWMFNKVNDDDNKDNLVTVVVNEDLTVKLLTELLIHDDTKLDFCNIDSFEYDREYYVELSFDENNDIYNIAVEQAYNYEKEMYFGTDGVVLFHEDVNSKALIDMQSNENVEITEYDWFALEKGFDKGKTDDISDKEETKIAKNKDTNSKYFVNGKPATEEQYVKVYDIFSEGYRKALLSYCEFMDEMNEWRKLLNW